MAASIASAITINTAAISVDTPVYFETESSYSEDMEILWDETAPKTGDHPAPIISAMGLAFSGVGLYILIDEKNRKK